jgi:hypothetical protein
MKSYLWIAVIVILPIFAACNRTVGECWPVGQGDQNGGVGSGPVIASGGTGDNGDSPPNPNDFKIPEADCNIAEQSPCTEKCLASYESAATTCGKIQDDPQRKTCQEGAYAGYKTCKGNCQNASKTCTDMFVACDDMGLPCNREIEYKKSLCAVCQRDCVDKRPYKYDECYKCGFEDL